MTDAKELAERLREKAVTYEVNGATRAAADINEAAAALEAQAEWIDKQKQDIITIGQDINKAVADERERWAEENERLRRVVESNLAGKPLEGEDLAWAEATVLQQQAAEIAHLAAANAKLMDEPAKLLRTIMAQDEKIAALKWAGDPEGIQRAKLFVRPEIEARLAEALAEVEAQNAKLVALGLARSCGCSVDAPGDVCVHHSPQLIKALSRIAALEQAAVGPPLLQAGEGMMENIVEHDAVAAVAIAAPFARAKI